MKDTWIISRRIKAFEGLTCLSSFIGKKVFSESGDYVGRVKDLIVLEDSVLGLLVKGKQHVLIDKEFVCSDTKEAIMLSIDPVSNIVGKQVYDADGRKLGKVVDIERKSKANTFCSLIVKKTPLSKHVTILKEDIEVSKENIILKNKYEK